jgi:hypothetical protein
MDYVEYETWIEALAAKSARAARRRFAHDTIHRLHEAADLELEEQISGDELALIGEILEHLDDDDVPHLEEGLQLLRRSMADDEFSSHDPKIAELLGAIDNWLEYRVTGNPCFIARLAINMINQIDHRLGGDGPDYSIDNMEGAAEMREEFHRQRHFLARS